MKNPSPQIRILDQKLNGINPQKFKKNALNSQLQTYQILTDDDQMLILCLSYSITSLTQKVGVFPIPIHQL